RTSAPDGNAEKGYPETAVSERNADNGAAETTVPERDAKNDAVETSAPDGNAENDISNTVSSDEKKTADPGKRRPARTAAERTVELYEFLLEVGAQARMDELSRQFGRDGDPVREKQYAQIYRALVDLLDQIYELAGDERVSARSYLELLEAGFSQIRLGTIPQQADRVLVGDMERTRLTQVRHLFFAGANDGNIPRGASRGGILSDMDREFLARGGASLSPTPRQQMFTQRLYLYLNMTKPSETLTVSFSKTSMDGRSLRPSYLVSLLQCIFPDLQLEFPETRPLREQINGSDTGYSLLAGMLRRFVEGNPEVQTSAGEREFRLVYGFFTSAEVMADPERRRAVSMLRRAALYRYRPETLQTGIARRLYGNMLSGGISRLETGAQCMLRQHLRYGLRLMERDIFAFAAVDAGTVLHAALQQFDAFLRRESNSWRTFTAEDAVRLTEKALYTVAARYRNLLFYNSSRDESRLLRLEKCLLRTVDTLQYQIRKGDLDPAASELSFGMEQTDSPEMAHAAAMPDVVVKPDAVAVPDVTGRPDYADPVSGAFFSGIDFSGTSSLPETAPQIPAPPETASMDVQEEMSLNAHNREAGSGRGMLPQQLPAIRFDLGNGRRLFLVGRIDRVDLYVQDGRCFVRILDYKTGSRDLDENQIRRGLQLQLITYMEALRNAFSGGLYMTFVRDEKGEKDSRDLYMPSGGNESAEHERAEKLPEMIPAAMLYYKMEDPVLSEEEASVLSFPDSGTPGRKESVLSDVPASFALSGKQISGEHSSGERISG
ncbi:MAG: PD-(D/E)XK nuclease family protein, partial [Eubacteriales bacterium]|nr:PD-(D/E)XK nuclease family protein [Eubacteriales bacterium]